MRLILTLFLLIPLAARAGPAPCAYEPTERSRAACLNAKTDVVRNRIDAEIAASTGDLMALSARDLRRFERAMRTAQSDWRRASDRACRRTGGPVIIATCRLHATIKRRRLVREELDRMRQRFGMAPPIRVPDEYEVLVPLPVPPGGPDVDTRLPLKIPVPGN